MSADQDTAVPDIVIKIQNVVCTINLGVRLDLVKITQTARNAEYNPTRFQVNYCNNINFNFAICKIFLSRRLSCGYGSRKQRLSCLALVHKYMNHKEHFYYGVSSDQ